MKTILFLITFFTFFSFLSCNQANQDSKEIKGSPTQGVNQNINSEEHTDSTESANFEEAEQPTIEENDAEVMLNPPHGEPNHRCDIPVGAPLNPLSANEENDAEVMLNPPHGEPNHRCDIPVGAPLNTAPTNTTRQTTNRQVQTTVPDLANNPTAPTIENAKRLNSTRSANTAAPATGEKPRLNPAHGQPWHRCDIAVGSPLP
ncbi:hypothetical protein [Marinilabilia salmonicolor]|uniref:Uncharacterized protein n=1 Tax=Marinilabilia salmonicolor TaxID=989 RepID=A0A368VFB9_9BACT|nr:hypothetical protein [Marinilabilia salmonicolor]RCW38925.1 hypothetical protein DFO77_10279 [Marinilabilia salmonicolor]